MTVADLLDHAARRGAIRFSYQGSGPMTMLTRLDDHANEGAAGRNWIYSINARPADRSYAVQELQAGDRVLWSFVKSD